MHDVLLSAQPHQSTACETAISCRVSGGRGRGARYPLRRRRRSARPTSHRVGLQKLKAVGRQATNTARRPRGRRSERQRAASGTPDGRSRRSEARPTGPERLKNWLPANLCIAILACPRRYDGSQQTKAALCEISRVSRRHGPTGPRLPHRRTAATEFVATRSNPPPKPHVAATSHVRLY